MMSHIWKFSPSSEPYLQRCLAAASFQENNKWIEKFGRKNELLKMADLEEKQVPEVIEIAPSPEEQEINDDSVTYEDFFDTIENEIRLDFISKKCSKNPDLILKMTQRLSENTVEKLFNHIFTSKDTENSFLTSFFTTFLPNYIKHRHSWLCIDILTKTDEIYPELFQKLLKILLEDTGVPDQVLFNYINTLNEEKHTKFIQELSNFDLSSESFTHNILTIYTAYKDCKKTERIQNFLKTSLIQHSMHCSSNRNYGKLFLAYLQAEKSLENTVDVKQLRDCLEVHRSPFKRPCITMLNDLVDNE